MTTALTRLFELEAWAREAKWEDVRRALQEIDLSRIGPLEARYVARPAVALGRSTRNWAEVTDILNRGSADLRQEAAREIGRLLSETADLSAGRAEVFRLLAGMLGDPDSQVVEAALLVWGNCAREDDVEAAGLTSAMILRIAASEDQWTAFQAVVVLRQCFGRNALLEAHTAAQKTTNRVLETSESAILRAAALEFWAQELPSPVPAGVLAHALADSSREVKLSALRIFKATGVRSNVVQRALERLTDDDDQEIRAAVLAVEAGLPAPARDPLGSAVTSMMDRLGGLLSLVRPTLGPLTVAAPSGAASASRRGKSWELRAEDDGTHTSWNVVVVAGADLRLRTFVLRPARPLDVRASELSALGFEWSGRLMEQVAADGSGTATFPLGFAPSDRDTEKITEILSGLCGSLEFVDISAAIDEAIVRLQHPDPDVRSPTARSLAPVAHEERVSHALASSLRDPHGSVRAAAASALAAAIHEEGIQRALLAGLEDKDVWVRLAATQVLSAVSHEEVVRRGLLARLDDSDGAVRLAAARALSPAARVEAVQHALLGRLEDSDPGVRWAATDALAPVAHVERVQRALLGRLEDSDHNVRSAAADALASVAQVVAVQRALLGRLEDPNEGVRLAAVTSLSPAASTQAVKSALRRLTDDPSALVRAAAQDALAKDPTTDPKGRRP